MVRLRNDLTDGKGVIIAEMRAGRGCEVDQHQCGCETEITVSGQRTAKQML
jgi:hypothetical protein